MSVLLYSVRMPRGLDGLGIGWWREGGLYLSTSVSNKREAHWWYALYSAFPIPWRILWCIVIPGKTSTSIRYLLTYLSQNIKSLHLLVNLHTSNVISTYHLFDWFHRMHGKIAQLAKKLWSVMMILIIICDILSRNIHLVWFGEPWKADRQQKINCFWCIKRGNSSNAAWRC